jgi:hypothetical protein
VATDPRVDPAVQWGLTLLVGNSWPEGDPPGIRHVGDIYRQVAEDLAGVPELIGSAVVAARDAGHSPALNSAVDYLLQIDGGQHSLLPAFFDQAGKVREGAYAVALEYEYAQIMLLEMAALLVYMIYKLTLLSIATGNPAPAASIVVVKQLLEELAEQVLWRLASTMAQMAGVFVGMDRGR